MGRFVPDEGAIGRIDEMPEVIRDLERRATSVERAAKRNCPVDTGRLRSSITHEVRQDGQGPLAVIGTDVTYAPYVELGTSHMAAQPFLLPALREAAG